MRLGIDFGTSTTIAVLQRDDGRVQQLLFDGSPLLSSAVLLGADGRLYTGRDAAHLARSAPERLEPNPKRRIDDTSVLLADAEVDVRDLVGAVLHRVAAEAARVAGPVRDVVLTHPASWGSGRRAVLLDAARRPGLDTVELVTEPLAAATFFTAMHGTRLPVGSYLLVYDLGAGTCDVTLLRRRPDGFEQVASDGLNDLGGLDVDAAIVGFLEATYGALWTDPATRLRLWDDVRSAKEMLSRSSGTVIMVPSLAKEVPLGREQLEGLARPVLRPSVAMTRALLADARVRPADIAGLFLVGGSSRIPLVATMLHEALGIAPVIAEQPELVVAEGALRFGVTQEPVSASVALPLSTMATPHASAPKPPPVSSRVSSLSSRADEPTVVTAPLVRPPRSRRRLIAAGTGLAVVAFAAFATYKTISTNDHGGNAAPPAPPKYAATRPPDNLCALIDLSALTTVYELEDAKASPERHVTAENSNASCMLQRNHRNTVHAVVQVALELRSENAIARTIYQSMVGDTAKLNVDPVALTGLGEEGVVWEDQGSSAKAKTDLTVQLGVIDNNLVWTVRLNLRRSDNAGWSAADKQDLRDRLVTTTRASLPKVTQSLT